MKDDKSFCIYMHTNILNDKKYIGQTKNYKKRCTPGNYHHCTCFYHAIQKYGWENFEHTILKENLTQAEADYWEKYYIKFYNTTNIEYGYNLSEGGSSGAILAKEHNPFYGHKHTKEAIETMKEKKAGGNNPKAKKVICLNTGEIFPSCKEASEWCGISRQNISRCARGERPTAGKHPVSQESLKWRYKDED